MSRATPSICHLILPFVAVCVALGSNLQAEPFESLPLCRTVIEQASDLQEKVKYRNAQDTEVLCSHRFAPLTAISPRPKAVRSIDLSVLSWNVYKGGKRGSGDDLRRLSRAADLVLLQETYLTEQWQWLLASAHLAEASPRKPIEFFSANAFFIQGVPSGVSLGSRLPVVDLGFLRSPQCEPWADTFKMSIDALLDLGLGQPRLLVINSHMINFRTLTAFRQQLETIRARISVHDGPILLEGDFNIWNRDRRSELLKLANDFNLAQVKLDDDPRLLDLDHLFVRGLEVTSARIRSDIKTSDHWPLEAHLIYHFQ